MHFVTLIINLLESVTHLVVTVLAVPCLVGMVAIIHARFENDPRIFSPLMTRLYNISGYLLVTWGVLYILRWLLS